MTAAHEIQRDLLVDGDADAAELAEAIREAAIEVGHKELLYRLGNCDRTTMENRITGRQGRESTARMLLELARLQPSERLLQKFCKLIGRAPPKLLSEETPQEKLERLVDAVRKEHGRAGEATITKVFGGGR